MSARPFLPGELVSPRQHAVMNGLELRELVQRHQAELAQWGAKTGLSPTAAALAALLYVLPRPRGRPLGVGLQLSVAALEAVLGRQRRMVRYALVELEERRLILRYRATRPVRSLTRRRPRPLRSFVDPTGRVRTHASITQVLYLTPAGLDLVAPFGRTRARIPGRGRREVVRGLVGSLLADLSSWLRATAARCASVIDDCTPYKELPSRKLLISTVEAPAPVENPRATGDPGALPLGSGWRGGLSARRAEIERCWSHTERVTLYGPRVPGSVVFGWHSVQKGEVERWTPILTADRWRPDAWRKADPETRGWLQRQFEPIRRELAARIARGEVYGG